MSFVYTNTLYEFVRILLMKRFVTYKLIDLELSLNALPFQIKGFFFIFSQPILPIPPLSPFLPPYPSHPLRSPILPSPSLPSRTRGKKHPQIQRNAQYRLTKACSHVSEPVCPRHCASKNTKKHPTVLLPSPSCIERLHTAPSQSILIKTVEPLNTRPSLHILPGMPVHPF